MKLFLLQLIAVLFVTFSLNAQETGNQSELPDYVTGEEYAQRKRTQTLNGREVILSNGMVNPDSFSGGVHYVKHFGREKSFTCGGYFPPSGPSLQLTALDDGWAVDTIDLQFNFCFFGQTRTQVWINNNGNISFSGGISAFSPLAFPSAGDEMIAAFWSDFDFNGGGTLHATVTPTALIVNWVNVGYYAANGDKRNTCQIIITDGTDPLIPGGNCAIHYDDMQWTTGDADGSNGFGGGANCATAGINRGNGVDYFTIGRFDHAGTDYDGPLGNQDGVDFLDGRSYSFDLCAAANGNLPPVPTMTQGVCDSLYVCSLNDVLTVSFPFLAPENNQVTTISYSTPTLNGVQQVSNTSGSLATLTLSIDGSLQTPGLHQILVTATDDFNPPGVTAMTYNLYVADWNAIFPNPLTIDYTMSCAPITYSASGGPYGGYQWSTGDNTPTTTISTAFNGTLSLTVDSLACINTANASILVPTPAAVNLSGNNFLCTGQNEATLWLADSLNLGDISWGLPGPTRDTMYINTLLPGNYTITLNDITGYCTTVYPLTVMAQQLVNLIDDTVVCEGQVNFNDNAGGAGTGQWTVSTNPPSAATPIFADPTDMNTTVTFPAPGRYYLIYTQNNCGYDDTIRVTNSVVNFTTTGSTFYCPSQTNTTISVDNPGFWSGFLWSSYAPAPNPPTPTASSNVLTEGTYEVIVFDTTGFCKDSSNITITTQDVVMLQNDTITCESQFTFTYNTGGSGSGTWAFGGAPAVPPTFNSTNLNTTVTFGAFGLYQLIFTDGVCNDPETINVLYRPKPPVNVITDFIVCAGMKEHVFLQDSATFESVSWGITPPAADTLFAANFFAGTYTVDVVTNEGCELDTTFTIANYPFVDLEQFTNVCGDSIEFNLHLGPPLGQWTTYNSAGTVNFRDDTELNTGLDVSNYGTYHLVFTDAFCGDKDTTTLKFIPYNGVDLMDTMDLCRDKVLEIPSNIFYPAFTDSIIWNTGATTPSISVTEGGYYYMEAGNVCGMNGDSVYVDIKVCDVELPNVFTPGNNGINSLWAAINPDDVFTEYQCVIVNRWGSLVYEFNTPTGSWDGKDMGGNEVEEGVYFYVIKTKVFDGTEIEKNGFIHLIRD